MDNVYKELLKYFDVNYAGVLTNAFENLVIEEIRIRACKPIVIHTATEVFFVANDGRCVTQTHNLLVFSEKALEDLVSSFCNHSIYAFDKDLTRGYITLSSGIRIGICGSGVFKEEKLVSIREFTGINIRIPRQIKSVSKKIMPYLFDGDTFLNTMIISPPNSGKTTLLRDIARAVGNGEQCKRMKTVIIDERGEIAGKSNAFDIGMFTDVISGVGKHKGIFMALRSLAPEVVMVDEVGFKDDLKSIFDIVNCGVGFVATAHAHSVESFKNRMFFKAVIKQRMIHRFVFLNCELGRGTVQYILDQNLSKMTSAPFLLI
jgi:stage III sporulation protein AA